MNSTEDMTPPAELSKGMANFRLHAFLQNDALTQRITSDLEQLNYAQILTSLAMGSIENTDQSFPIQEQALDIASAEQSRGSGSHRAKRRVKPSRKLLELQEINDGKPQKAFNMKYKTGAGVAKGPRGITGDGKVPVNEIWQDKNSDNKLKNVEKNNNYLVKRDALERTKGKTDGINFPGRILRKNKQHAAMKDGFKPVESVGNQICTEKTLRNDAGMQVENTNELGGNEDGGMEGNFSGGSKEAMNDGSGSSDEKSRYKCEQCGKHFKTYYTFSIHIRMPEHTKETPFVCDICGKGFRLSSTLCRHKIIHTSNKPHQCSVCRKTFNRSSTLKMHMRTHSTRKQHVCGTCGKGFHQKGNLRNHMFVHSGERPFCCETCGRHFNKKSNLKHHLKIHEINGEFSCTICKKVFDEPGGLREHMQTRHCHL